MPSPIGKILMVYRPLYLRGLLMDGQYHLAAPTTSSEGHAMWHNEESIDTSASPESVWPLLADVAGWKEWNAGIEMIELHGPFADGTTFTMTPPGESGFTSTLLAVKEYEGFIDETWIGDTCVRVEHRLVRLPSGGTRITYRSHVTGPEAQALGLRVTSDFAEVLKALRQRAEQAAASGQRLAPSP